MLGGMRMREGMKYPRTNGDFPLLYFMSRLLYRHAGGKNVAHSTTDIVPQTTLQLTHHIPAFGCSRTNHAAAHQPKNNLHMGGKDQDGAEDQRVDGVRYKGRMSERGVGFVFPSLTEEDKEREGDDG
ncbi:glycosyltransferase family 76 protein [Moniliophthora roreri]|nr:glycosyltransferase family 76 protein [Moniliophthora roreri]